MSETEAPEKADIWVEIAGERIQLVLPGMGWTFDEARVAKQISGGMAPVEIESRLFVTDPDAWTAVIRVSFKRAGKEFPKEQLEGEDIIALGDVVTKSVLEELGKLPPTRPSGNESSEPAEETELEEITGQS